MPTIEEVNAMLAPADPGSLTRAAGNFQVVSEAFTDAGDDLGNYSQTMRDNASGRWHSGFQQESTARTSKLQADGAQSGRYPKPLNAAAKVLDWGKKEAARLLTRMNEELAKVPADAPNAATAIAAIRATFDALATDVLNKVTDALQQAASALTGTGSADPESESDSDGDDAAKPDYKVDDKAPDGTELPDGDEPDFDYLVTQGFDANGAPLGGTPLGGNAPDAVVGKPPYNPETTVDWSKTPSGPTAPPFVPPSLTPPPPSSGPSATTPPYVPPLMPGVSASPATQTTGYNANRSFTSAKGGHGPTVLGRASAGTSSAGGVSPWGGNGLSSNLTTTGAEVASRPVAATPTGTGPATSTGGMPFMGAGVMGTGVADNRNDRQRKPGLGEEDAWDVGGDATPAVLGREE